MRGRPAVGSRLVGPARTRAWDVAGLQFLLGLHGFSSGHVHGDYGAETRAAVARLQAWAGIVADGIAGPSTFAALARTPPRSPLRFLRPVAAPRTDPFGPRDDRGRRGTTFLPRSARACVPRVAAAWPSPARGGRYDTTVVLRHGLGVTSWSAHLSSVPVERGTCVRAGKLIGRVGSTGHSTGPHLHFEVRLRGAAVDPEGTYGAY